MNFRAWQLRATVLIAVLAPPLSMFIFSLVTDAPLWGRGSTGPQNIYGTLLVFLWYGIPVSYIVGFVPALIAAAAYCGVLTLNPRLIPRPFIRSLAAALIGAVVGTLWIYVRSDSAPMSLDAAAIGVFALLALRWPRPRVRP